MVQTAPITRRPTTAAVVAVVAVAAVLIGIVAVVLLAVDRPGTAHAAAATPHPAASSATTHAATPATTPTPAPTPTTHPVVLPAAQVRTIQQELASLNYYEGPINGVMTPQTVQAITYLQRDAQLPQNGEWNQVTYLAMQRMLATGNNQMAG